MNQVLLKIHARPTNFGQIAIGDGRVHWCWWARPGSTRARDRTEVTRNRWWRGVFYAAERAWTADRGPLPLSTGGVGDSLLAEREAMNSVIHFSWVSSRKVRLNCRRTALTCSGLRASNETKTARSFGSVQAPLVCSVLHRRSYSRIPGRIPWDCSLSIKSLKARKCNEPPGLA